MSFFRRLSFDLWYLHRPPWDSGIVPPEVETFIRDNSPRRLLDLGCGTGTSSLAFARAGWKVTGVDFASHAILIAKRKAHLANVNVDFQIAEVAHLPQFLFSVQYNLVLDIGCFHGLSLSGKTAYLNQLKRLLITGGIWLMYGFFMPGDNPILDLISTDPQRIELKLRKRQDGMERKVRPSAWFWFEKM